MRGAEKTASKILAFPALQSIPEPEFPLTGLARAKYDELAKMLLNARKLNTFTRMKCETFATLYAGAAKRVSLNQAPSNTAMAQMDKLMKELQLVDDSDAVAPAQQGAENRYSRIGVIIRPGAKATSLR